MAWRGIAPDRGDLCAATRVPSTLTGARFCLIVRPFRSDPGFGIYVGMPLAVAWLVMKSNSHGDLGGENHGDEPVDAAQNGGHHRVPAT